MRATAIVTSRWASYELVRVGFNGRAARAVHLIKPKPPGAAHGLSLLPT
jgi:hypothetical protein